MLLYTSIITGVEEFRKLLLLELRILKECFGFFFGAAF